MYYVRTKNHFKKKQDIKRQRRNNKRADLHEVTQYITNIHKNTKQYLKIKHKNVRKTLQLPIVYWKY